MEVKFTIDKSGKIYYRTLHGYIFWRGDNSLGFNIWNSITVCKTCIHDEKLYILLSVSTSIHYKMSSGEVLVVDIMISREGNSNKTKTFVFEIDGTPVTGDVIYYSLLIKINNEPEKYIFHPPNLNIEHYYRLKWFKSQIQFMKGNELPMCLTNYDLVIKYQ